MRIIKMAQGASDLFLRACVDANVDGIAVVAGLRLAYMSDREQLRDIVARA